MYTRDHISTSYQTCKIAQRFIDGPIEETDEIDLTGKVIVNRINIDDSGADVQMTNLLNMPDGYASQHLDQTPKDKM